VDQTQETLSQTLRALAIARGYLRECTEELDAAKAHAADAEQRCSDAIAVRKSKERELNAALLRVDAYEESLERTSSAFAIERRRHKGVLMDYQESRVAAQETQLVAAIVAQVTLSAALRATVKRLTRQKQKLSPN
jgi:hypothetical protein